jgi:8-oxo-dGTP diphosphatase
MTRAVCGFYFSSNRERVVFIQKKRPDWQASLLNGVGGKVEEGEFAMDAMRREFREETGVDVEDWEPFCVLNDEIHRFEVTYFRATAPTPMLDHCKTMTDEEVMNFPVGAVFTLPVVHNLTWLIPMALDQSVSSVRAVWRDA